MKCTECKKCNSVVKPSVLKGSAYCDLQLGILNYERYNVFISIKNKIKLFLKRDVVK
jgi:hypothetical protein